MEEEQPKQPTISKTKEYIKEYNKKRYLNNREALLQISREKYFCKDCNKEIVKYFKCRHEKTKKHIKNREFFKCFPNIEFDDIILNEFIIDVYNEL
jgi:hypothetical protein